MSDTVETHQHNGYTIEIVVDDTSDVESPRDYDGNLGIFVGLPHRSYNIGDEQLGREHEIQCVECGGTGEVLDSDGTDTQCEACLGSGSRQPASQAELMADLKRVHQARVILPVGMLDHSGVSYYIGGGPHWSDSAGWDSGTCGFIMDTPDRLKAAWGEQVPTDEQIIAGLTSEVEVYSSWASGDVYGIVVKDPNGDDVESCWGFIGLEHAESSWRDMVPAEPPPPTLHDLRLTDAQLDTIEHALNASTSAVSAEVLETIRKARA